MVLQIKEKLKVMHKDNNITHVERTIAACLSHLLTGRLYQHKEFTAKFAVVRGAF